MASLSTVGVPRLYAIVDVEACARAGRDPVAFARALVAGGARLLQLRAKQMASGALLQLAREMAADAATAGARLIVNDRADIAALAGAAGVHVGQDDLPVSAVRRIVGSDAVVGLSTHTLEQLEAALDQPVSYVALGPVFGTGTKDTGYTARGLEMLREAATRAAARGIPLVAIGGITLDRARAVWALGAASAAAIGDLLTDDPAARAAAWVAAGDAVPLRGPA
jgi:thiamine-phosphate pyrophosphorylase